MPFPKINYPPTRGDSSNTLPDAGQNTMGESLSVTIASDQSPITIAPLHDDFITYTPNTWFNAVGYECVVFVCVSPNSVPYTMAWSADGGSTSTPVSGYDGKFQISDTFGNLGGTKITVEGGGWVSLQNLTTGGNFKVSRRN